MKRASAEEWEVSAIAAQEPRLNEEITVRECRLIGFDGEQMGIYVTAEAQRVADNQGPVSYTHLDVYKRQAKCRRDHSRWGRRGYDLGRRLS